MLYRSGSGALPSIYIPELVHKYVKLCTSHLEKKNIHWQKWIINHEIKKPLTMDLQYDTYISQGGIKCQAKGWLALPKELDSNVNGIYINKYILKSLFF